MKHLPEALQKLIDHFDALPGIGPKHATRLALYVIDRKQFAENFSRDIAAAIDSVKLCSRCQNVTDGTLCSICSDKNRDASIICVISHVQDVDPVERTAKFNGTYHVLHGTLNPMEGVTPDQVKIKELFNRVKNDGIKEVILALDATSEGEATMLYLAKELKKTDVSVTKLARGIPMGSSIEYTDEVTLSSALENRR